MRLPKIANYNSLTADEQYKYEMQAIADGKISGNYSIAQISNLYRQQQLANLGLNTDWSEDQANAYLKLTKLQDLAKAGQIGEEVAPLFQLAQDNPILASQLADQLFDNGYLTLDERNQRAESALRDYREGTDWLTDAANWIGSIFTSRKGVDEDTKSLSDYDAHAFNDYYDKVKENYKSTAIGRAQMEQDPKGTEESIIKEARRMYLADVNSNIYSDIQKQIDNYWEGRAAERGAELKQQLDQNDLGPLDSNNISQAFNAIVSPREDKDGTIHNGSNYYNAFKDSAFDDFGIEQQKDVLAKYQAYTELLGPQKADEWLENTMQSWVSDHQSAWDRALNTANAFKNTIVNNVGTRMLNFAVWGLAKVADWGLTGAANLFGADVDGTALGDVASILETGRDQRGRTPEEAGFGRTLGENGSLFWLRGDYLSKVDQYNTWNRQEQQRAEANGGVSDDMQYVLKPGQNSPDFWSMGNLQDVLGMTSQITGQVAALYLYGGGGDFTSLASQIGKNGAKALLTREAASTCIAGLKEATITAAPIAQSYAYGAYKQVYDGAMQMAMDNLYQDAQQEFMTYSSSDEYKAEREQAYKQWLNGRGNSETGYRFMIDSDSNREQFNQMYDQNKLEEIAQRYKDTRQEGINAIVQSAATDAWMTSFTGEYLKYGMLNAALQPLKVLKSPNQVIQSELRTNAYGRLTQSAAGKFTNEGVPLFGVKKWATINPKVVGTYKVAQNAIVAGGLSNYTDEMVTGFAMGFGLSKFNSEYMRTYDPEAYAETWHGGNAIGEFMDAIGQGISGGVQAGLTEQAWHAFEIGAIGGLFAPRFLGVKQMKEKYSAENAEELARTGNRKINPWKKFRQGFNTYVTGSIGEYENARFGLNQVSAYNQAIDQRDELFTELAALHSTILNGSAAQANNDFASAANAQDAIAMKLVANQHALSSNPLHQVSNQQSQTDAVKLSHIAQGDVSNEEKERLISDAINTSQQGKQGPVTQQMKDQVWQEIQEVARRTSQFVQDYHEEESRLLELDGSFAQARNYPILSQRAELVAQQKRLTRDIEDFSERSGLQVKADSRGVYGEMTQSQRESLQKAIEETKNNLLDQREEAHSKLSGLEEDLSDVTDEAYRKDLQDKILKERVHIRAIDRHIAELRNSSEAVNNSELLLASSGISNDATVLHDMLSNPEQYSEDQQAEIEKLRTQIGPQGETYITEMAKMQDQLRDNEYALQSIQEAPEDYLGFRSMLGQSRLQARNIAIYNQELANAYSTVASQNNDVMGITAALSFTPEQFEGFQRQYPDLAPVVQTYTKINQAFSSIKSLLGDSPIGKDIIKDVTNLMSNDHEYLMDNGDQGVVDMLEFLKYLNTQNVDKKNALDNLITDFKRISSIEQSTAAFTEYKIKKTYEQSRESADQLVEELERAQHQDQQAEVKEEVEEVPDMASMDNDTGEAIDLGDEVEKQTTTETEEQEGTETKETPETEVTEAPVKSAEKPTTEELPASVIRNSEGNLETMTAEQQAEQLGITKVTEDSMVDDQAPRVQDITEQQEEVHGCYFNIYEGQALKTGELVPFTEGPVYEWLSKEGINLGDIIDNELSNILKVNPKVQLMKVKKDGEDSNVASNVFLVVEYTDRVAKHHLPENGGVITSNGKQYLIVGTMWNTKAQERTEAANLMQATRNTLQRNGVNYFNANPAERFYVDPAMNTEVTTFYSGHIVHTVNDESHPRTITELLDEHNRTHTSADSMSMSDLGFGVITMREGFYPVGPHSADKIHAPQRRTPDKYGQVYVLVPAANGEIVPIFINPTLLSEIKESELKTRIDTVLIPQLLSEDYFIREQAISELCQLLCITGSITNPDGKGILIGTKDIPTVSLVNGKSIIRTFDVKKNNFTIEEFRQAIYALNPRINLSLSNLAQPSWIQRYDEAGALTTDSVKLGTFGGKYYVAPINPATGQPIRVEQKVQPIEVVSDYSKASTTPVMLPVGGQTYVLRDGKWVHQKDGSAVTDRDEQIQVTWAYRVQTGEATLARRQGNYDYYIKGVETSEPIVVAYSLETRKYYGVPQELADQIIAERRAELEKERADAEAVRVLDEAPSVTESEAEPINRPNDGVIKEVEKTTKTGKKASGKYVVSSDSNGNTNIKFEGTGYAKIQFSADDIGLPIDSVIGTRDTYNTEESYQDLVESAKNGSLTIDSITINSSGEIVVHDINNGITIEGQAARTIYDKFFADQFEAPKEQKQEQVTQTDEAKKIQKAQEKLARVEAALESPEVKLWSDNPWDNVTITVTYNGFNQPIKKSRLWNTAHDVRVALNAEVGTTLRDGTKVIYKDRNGATYVEFPNTMDGEVKSAILFPTGGRGGDNFTVHFYKTLDADERGSLISIIRDKQGMSTQSLVPYINALLQSVNSNLQYLRYRNQDKLDSLRLEASQRNSEESIQEQIETIDVPSEILSYFNSSEYTGSVTAIQRKFGITYSTALKYKESFEAQKKAGVKIEPKKNDFELEQVGQQDSYSIDQILDSVDEAMMEYADRIFEIIENKIATEEKWKDFDMNNISAELERLGVETSTEDIESWIDNLENCK